MAQNITLLGASYSAVPAVELPKTGGGTARFDDVTVTTATAEDVAQGKVFVASDGSITTGTASGGGTTEVTVTDSGAVIQEMLPDTMYHFTSTALMSLTITFAGDGTEQYHFDFISSATAVTLTLPASVTMETPFSVEANTKYEIDIYQGYGVFAEWVAS